MSIELSIYLGMLLLQVLIAGWLVYLKKYMEQKAQNAATKEDIAIITQTQKSIEAKITDQVWDRQMRWTTKKEIYFRVVNALGEAFDCVADIMTATTRLKGAIMLRDADQQNRCNQDITVARQNLVDRIAQLRTGAYSLHLITETAPLDALQSVLLNLSALSQAAVFEQELVLRIYKDLETARSGFIACAKADLGFSSD